MIPILYPKNETAFTSNGIGRLAECISFTVTEERNGIFEAEFVYPITGKHYAEIEEGMIVSALHDDSRAPQPFEIYRRTAPIDGLVTFYAHHVSYKAGNVIINPPVTARTCAEALAALSESTVNTNPFTLWTDKASQGTFNLGYPISLKQILGGVQGSILDAFGGGEYEWDKWTIRLYQRRGTDTDVEIRYGKNLKDIEKDLDVSGCYNAVVPYWYNAESGTLVMLPEKVLKADPAFAVEYPWTNESAAHIQTESAADIEFAVLQAVPDSDLITVPMDLSDVFEAEPTAAELRSAATSRLEASEAWVPDQNIKVDFVALWQTEEYAQLAPLQRVKLCDTLRVIYTALGVDVRMKVIKTVYNCLLERYDEIELGKAKTSFAEMVMADTDAKIKQLPTKGFMEAAIEKATELITGGLGGYVVMNLNADGQPQEILIMDSEDKETAVNVIRLNKNGIGFSTNGYNGPFTSAWTIDGTFNAQVINVINLTANAITSGTMSADRILGGTMRLGKVGEAYGELITYEANNGREVFVADMYGVKGRSNSAANYDASGYNAFGYLCDSHAAVPSGGTILPSTYVLGNCSEITVGGTRYVNTAGHRTDGRPVDYRTGIVPTSGTTRDAGAGNYTDIDDVFVGGSQYTHYEQKGDRYTYQMSGPSRTLRYNLGIENDYPFMTLTSWPKSSGDIYTLLDFYRGHGPAYASSSSRRYKHDIKPISGDRDPARLLNLPVVEFLYNDNHPLQYADMEGQTLPGLIAEDVAEIYPSAAIRDADGNVESWDERRIIPGMLALIQEQQRRIDKLEAQLAQLLDRLEG